jgi:chromate transport protein ChrA
LKDDKTCLLVPRSGLNSIIVMFPSCSSFFFFSSFRNSSSSFSYFFFFSLLLSIMFTIACIILLCAYFQGFLFVRFSLAHSLELVTKKKKERMETRNRVV